MQTRSKIKVPLPGCLIWSYGSAYILLSLNEKPQYSDSSVICANLSKKRIEFYHGCIQIRYEHVLQYV